MGGLNSVFISVITAGFLCKDRSGLCHVESVIFYEAVAGMADSLFTARRFQ